MFYRRQGFPDVGEMVMCKVTKIHYNSVFVNILEYATTGMIHISEISPGRIRNIYDYVKEGKVVVCKVLHINKEKGHIDLSLRRVSDNQRKLKVNEIKQERLAEKIVEFLAKQMKTEAAELYAQIKKKISKEYDSLYACFEDSVIDENLLEKLGIDKKLSKELNKAIALRIKPKQVEITGKFVLSSYESNGVDVIRDSILEAEKVGGDKISVRYAGGGAYKFVIQARDYKEAEDIFGRAGSAVMDFISGKNGTGKIIRSEK